MRPEVDRMDASAVRNLDDIQEDEPGARPSRVGALVLASLGGACIVFAAVALMRAPPKAKVTAVDPLGDLVARAHPAGTPLPRPDDKVGQEVTFPDTLSDAKSPTTALEAVRDPKAMAAAAGAPTAAPDALPFDLPPGAPTTPPSAADRLPVVPLPAGQVLHTGASEPAAGDTLTAMATQVSRDTGAETAPAGTPGGYQLQVSSFKTASEAESFAAALRRRGHKAYVEPAQVKGRGLWHRVRIGPFKYRRSAVLYRQDFESKERMVTFIVDPPKTTVTVKKLDDDGDL
ncbi:MAG: SPOR domain-containing protein [Byssovorax sp.]